MSDLRISSWPWEYIPGTEHHGPYVAGLYGGDICDCYAMSNPLALSQRNGGTSKPIWHQAEYADANARLIAAAPELFTALEKMTSDYAGWNSVNDPLLVEATAALAKARGEQ